MDDGFERGVDVAHEAVHAATVHVRRIAGILTGTAGRLAQEITDLVWDYQDIAAETRRRPSDELQLREDIRPDDIDLQRGSEVGSAVPRFDWRRGQ